jgi:hypothetical protein
MPPCLSVAPFARMQVPLAALVFFAILTLWVPGYWATAVFQVGIFSLAAIAVWRARLSPPVFDCLRL